MRRNDWLHACSSRKLVHSHVQLTKKPAFMVINQSVGCNHHKKRTALHSSVADFSIKIGKTDGAIRRERAKPFPSLCDGVLVCDSSEVIDLLIPILIEKSATRKFSVWCFRIRRSLRLSYDHRQTIAHCPFKCAALFTKAKKSSPSNTVYDCCGVRKLYAKEKQDIGS